MRHHLSPHRCHAHISPRLCDSRGLRRGYSPCAVFISAQRSKAVSLNGAVLLSQLGRELWQKKISILKSLESLLYFKFGECLAPTCNLIMPSSKIMIYSIIFLICFRDPLRCNTATIPPGRIPSPRPTLQSQSLSLPIFPTNHITHIVETRRCNQICYH